MPGWRPGRGGQPDWPSRVASAAVAEEVDGTGVLVGAAVVVQDEVGVGEAVPADEGVVVPELVGLVVDPDGHAAVVVEDDGVVVAVAEVVGSVVEVVLELVVVLVVDGEVVLVGDELVCDEVVLVAVAEVVAAVVGGAVRVREAVLGVPVGDEVLELVLGRVVGRAEADAGASGAGWTDGGPTSSAAEMTTPPPVVPSASGVILGTSARTVAR